MSLEIDTLKAGTEVIDFMRLCYRAGRSPLLVGLHGVGKSQLSEQATEAMGIGLVVRDLCLQEPPDLVGLPKMDGETTKYLPPDFLPRDPESRGILLLEEVNRAPVYMRAPCLQLLTSRTLNDYKLPEGWLPAATINPSDGDYEAVELDPALRSRFVQVNVVADREEWLNWAYSNDIHQAVTGYVEADTTVFDSPDSNPRAWTYVSDIVKTAEKDGFDRHVLLAAVAGLVGTERGAAFLKTLMGGPQPLTAKQILNGYDKIRGRVKQWSAAGQLDLVKATLRAIELHLQPEDAYKTARGDKKQWASLGQFLYDLPGDLRNEARESFTDRDYTFPAAPQEGQE